MPDDISLSETTTRWQCKNINVPLYQSPGSRLYIISMNKSYQVKYSPPPTGHLILKPPEKNLYIIVHSSIKQVCHLGSRLCGVGVFVMVLIWFSHPVAVGLPPPSHLIVTSL